MLHFQWRLLPGRGRKVLGVVVSKLNISANFTIKLESIKNCLINIGSHLCMVSHIFRTKSKILNEGACCYSSKCLNRHFFNKYFSLLFIYLLPDLLFGSWCGFVSLASKRSHGPVVLTLSGSDNGHHHLRELTSTPHSRGTLSGPRLR